jgi:hypothetical protein
MQHPEDAAVAFVGVDRELAGREREQIRGDRLRFLEDQARGAWAP